MYVVGGFATQRTRFTLYLAYFRVGELEMLLSELTPFSSVHLFRSGHYGFAKKMSLYGIQSLDDGLIARIRYQFV
jgi:hypothetical protein